MFRMSSIWVTFVFYCAVSFTSGEKTEATKRVCVIGAGISGLTSARYLKEANINFTVFETTEYVGGTWRYEPRVGNDDYGQPIHTSMYKHLRTNLPKPTMQLRDFPLPADLPSFPTGGQYYNYIKDYAKHFDLKKHIKFLHLVTSVKREKDLWKVKYKNIPTGEEFEAEFEYVIVGSGHHSKPNMPKIPGEQLFKGNIIHSHDYRDSSVYKDRRVLIVGAGPSGMDISLAVAEYSQTLVHSHHSPGNFKTPWPHNYIRKRDVKEFNETGAIFDDGTFEELDDVIYCTGFQYYYPFLDESCGLTITPRSVIPLHKDVVNIYQPTMLLTGLVVRAGLVVAIDAQARYCTAIIKGNFTLPSREQMLEQWQTRANAIRSRGRPLSDIHLLSLDEDDYYAALTAESGISRVPPVIFKIRVKDIEAKLENLYTYRNYEYTVVDDQTFTWKLKTCTNNTTASCTP